ncbi:hypothetical protein [Brevibacillus daliensis]|uniref:hypothetical protein n=1 Tax=Brevibacillus daliensis TaxID=2892995 RepID=UPI001E353F08|nr:hypothetical protein [Brevibacillus daliensis]
MEQNECIAMLTAPAQYIYKKYHIFASIIITQAMHRATNKSFLSMTAYQAAEELERAGYDIRLILKYAEKLTRIIQEQRLTRHNQKQLAPL